MLNILAKVIRGLVIFQKFLLTWKISGRYEINGNSIKVRVNIRQGKAAPRYRIEVSGTTDKLEALVNEIVNQVLKLPEFKK